MIKKLLLLSSFACLFLAKSNAQTFTQTSGASILDNTTTYVPINVSGLPSVADSTFGILSCRINITHTYTGDIKIWLKSPSGDSTNLSFNRGGSGDNYTNTVFKMSASTFIGDGVNPYTGNFVPENSLNLLNNQQNPNGQWLLGVRDEVPSDVGTIIDFTLEFGANPPSDPPPPPGPCSMANGQNCFCPDGSNDCDLLPDMLSSAQIIINQHTEYPGQITLSNATPNVGWGPMEIHGVDTCFCGGVQVPCSQATCPDGSYVKQLVKQTVYHKSSGVITSYQRSAGFMSYHPSHGHIHVDNWADFSLRQSNGNPDATTWPILGTGTKMSFCLINLGDCTSNLGYCRDSQGNNITMADVPNAPFGMVSGCGTDQGIFTGHLDIYSQGMSGMSIDVGTICNGDYYIVSITDPNNNFLEQDETNNWVAVPITLTDQLPATSAQFTSNVMGSNVILSANVSDGASYSWNFGDGSPEDTTNVLTMHTYPGPGSYIVSLSVASSCTTFVLTDTIQVADVTVNTTNLDITRNFSSSPNPFKNTTQINYSLLKNASVNLEVYNTVGQKVCSIANGNQTAGNYKYNFNPEDFNLGSGLYFVRLASEDKTQVIRLIYSKQGQE